MLDLVKSSIEVYGPIDLWKRIRQVSATLSPSGGAWNRDTQEPVMQLPTRITAEPRIRRVTFDPLPAPGHVGIYTPFRASIETPGGAVVEGLDNPRHSFELNEKAWTAPQLAFFVGNSLWNCLMLPFSLLTDGVQCEEIDPWIGEGKPWRAVRIALPAARFGHALELMLYFDDHGLIRRLDCPAETSRGETAAHSFFGHQKMGDFVFPMTWRIQLSGLIADQTSRIAS